MQRKLRVWHARRGVHVQHSGMTTRTAWTFGKLYKPGTISTRSELSRTAERCHRTIASSPLCVCIAAFSNSFSLYPYVQFDF